MISILVCSINPDLLAQLRANLESTIGVPFEFIAIDNRNSNKGICKVYNELLEQANYSIALLIHEDILFRTNEWGKILVNYFNNDEKLGLIGVAGGSLKTKAPSTWWDVGNGYTALSLFQHHPNGSIEYCYENSWQLGETEKEAKMLDGVFLALRRNVDIKFNDKITGFHNYDLSISVEYAIRNYKILVVKNILLEHISNGKIDEKWIESSHSFYKLYKNLLPVFLDTPPDKKLESRNYLLFILLALKYKKRKIAIYHWWQMFKLSPVSLNHLRIIKNIFWKQQ